VSYQQPTQTAPPGRPPKRKHRARNILLSVVAALVVLIVLGAALGGGKTGNNNNGGTPVSGAAGGATTAPAVASKGPGIDQAVRDGKFQFTILKVTHAKRAGGQFLKQTAQGEYTILHVKITNIGDQAQTIDDSAQYLYDAAGRQFSADSTADIYGNPNSGGVWLDQVNPGDSVTGKLYFDMPKGDKAVRAELHDSAFSGGVSVSLTR
jgi:hypothetical protein